MKNLFLKIMVFAGLLGFFGCKTPTDPDKWNKKQVDTWFEKGEWLNGWQVRPDPTINRKAFAISYYNHKDRWDKAFSFLKNNDLATMEAKRYELDGVSLYAPVSDYMTKNEEDVKYETHRRYIDIQYVASGKELIGIVPVSQQKEILVPYDETKDVMFVSVSQTINFKATPESFFIFFPDDLHRPGLKDGESSPVRKVVVKVKID